MMKRKGWTWYGDREWSKLGSEWGEHSGVLYRNFFLHKAGPKAGFYYRIWVLEIKDGKWLLLKHMGEEQGGHGPYDTVEEALVMGEMLLL